MPNGSPVEALTWLFSAEQYEGEGSIPQRVAEHFVYTAGATAVAAVIAVPIDISLVTPVEEGPGWSELPAQPELCPLSA